MVGDGMVGTGVHVKRGDPRPERAAAGVRALIVARKRGNARGAKGRREVET